MNVEIEPGRRFSLPSKPGIPVVVERIKPNGSVELLDESTGGTLTLSRTDFLQAMRSRKIEPLGSAAGSPAGATGIDPAHFSDPDEHGLSKTERRDRLRKIKQYHDARALQFFAILHDKDGSVGKSDRGLKHFIRTVKPEAVENGIKWIPSASALRRALGSYGSVGCRPLHCFLARFKKNTSSRWPLPILDLKRRTCRYYWSSAKPSIAEATVYFNAVLDRYNARLANSGMLPFEDRPGDETIRVWIHGFVTAERYGARHGAHAAGRKYRGRTRAIGAARALEIVMVDHTQIDAHAVLRDDDGSELYRGRPWLTIAMDVHSRMVLAAVLTFDPPSTATVVLALRQILSPKTELMAKYGEMQGATDGYGQPTTLVVDNGIELNSLSLRQTCEGLGIHFEAAGVGCPQHKAHIERYFETLNRGLWHNLTESVPHKPHVIRDLKMRPADGATRTVDELERLLWQFIVTRYHRSLHSGLKTTPAAAWRKSISAHGRRVPQDMSLLDAFGRISRCNLTPYGVRLDGFQFHDPETTSQLLDSLLRLTDASDRRVVPGRTGSVPVLAVSDPTDCSAVRVWDPVRRSFCRLPNSDPRFKIPIEWSVAKSLASQDIPEVPDREQETRAAEALRRKTSPTRRRAAVAIAKELKAKAFLGARLADGAIVEVRDAAPTASGMDQMDISVRHAAAFRSDSRIPPKEPSPGKRKSSRKPAASKAADPPRRPIDNGETLAGTAHLVSDPAEFLKRLEEDMNGDRE